MSFKFDRLSTLIVDDNRHMLNLISEILRGIGVRQIKALTDSAAAFKELSISPADFIVCDHVMEPLTGIEFTRLLRTSADSPDKFVPVIMTTGYSDRGTVIEARDAGITEFLAKPITAKALYGRVLEVINNPRPFIRSKTYFGPDRRRRDEPYDGPERRTSDPDES